MEAGKVHRTFSDAGGKFVFLGEFNGPVKIEGAGAVQVIPQRPSLARQITLQAN